MPCEELRSSWKEVQFQLTRSNLQSVVEYIMRNGKTNGNITIRYGGRRQINLDFNETIDITKILNDLYNLGFVYIFIGCSDLTDPKVLGGQYMEGGRRQVCREASVPGESGVYRESVSRVLSGVAVSDGDAGKEEAYFSSLRIEELLKIKTGKDLLACLCNRGENQEWLLEASKYILANRFKLVANRLITQGYDRIIIGSGGTECYYLQRRDWDDFFSSLKLESPIRILKPSDAVQPAEISEDRDTVSCEVHGTVSREDAMVINDFLRSFFGGHSKRHEAYRSILMQLLSQGGMVLNGSWNKIEEKAGRKYDRDTPIAGQEVTLSNLESLRLQEEGKSGRYNRICVALRNGEMTWIRFNDNSQIKRLRIKFIKKPVKSIAEAEKRMGEWNDAVVPKVAVGSGSPERVSDDIDNSVTFGDQLTLKAAGVNLTESEGDKDTKDDVQQEQKVESSKPLPEPIHILSKDIFPCEIERINRWIQEGNSFILINKKDREVPVGDCSGFVCEKESLYKNNSKRKSPKFVFENFKEIRFVRK